MADLNECLDSMDNKTSYEKFYHLLLTNTYSDMALTAKAEALGVDYQSAYKALEIDRNPTFQLVHKFLKLHGLNFSAAARSSTEAIGRQTKKVFNPERPFQDNFADDYGHADHYLADEINFYLKHRGKDEARLYAPLFKCMIGYARNNGVESIDGLCGNALYNLFTKGDNPAPDFKLSCQLLSALGINFLIINQLAEQ
jgi:DNA-binding phage protein